MRNWMDLNGDGEIDSNFDITIVNDTIEKLDNRVINFIEGVEK